MDRVSKVIEYYEKLCVERPGSSYWSENIIDASSKIVDNNDHANFYTYLSNPEQFQYRENIKTLGDLDDSQLEKIEQDLQALSHSDQTTNVFENGSDRVFLIKNQDDEKIDFNDEKIDLNCVSIE